jgi:hypothetical protein
LYRSQAGSETIAEQQLYVLLQPTDTPLRLAIGQ